MGKMNCGCRITFSTIGNDLEVPKVEVDQSVCKYPAVVADSEETKRQLVSSESIRQAEKDILIKEIETSTKLRAEIERTKQVYEAEKERVISNYEAILGPIRKAWGSCASSDGILGNFTAFLIQERDQLRSEIERTKQVYQCSIDAREAIILNLRADKVALQEVVDDTAELIRNRVAERSQDQAEKAALKQRVRELSADLEFANRKTRELEADLETWKQNDAIEKARVEESRKQLRDTVEMLRGNAPQEGQAANERSDAK